MKIRPLHDRLIVKRLEEERKTASGIVIPDSAAEKPEQGEVKAIGKGKVLEDGKVRAIDLKVGDRVLFGKYSGQTVKVEGEELIVMKEGEITWQQKKLSFMTRPARKSWPVSISSPMRSR